jgi:hypothetical protein
MAFLFRIAPEARRKPVLAPLTGHSPMMHALPHSLSFGKARIIKTGSCRIRTLQDQQPLEISLTIFASDP